MNFLGISPGPFPPVLNLAYGAGQQNGAVWRSRPFTFHSLKMALKGKLKGFLFLFPVSFVMYFAGMFFLPPFLLLLFLPWGVQLSDRATSFVASLFFKLAPVSSANNIIMKGALISNFHFHLIAGNSW